MNEDFVPFELAVKLKEKEFDYPCIVHYDINKELKVVLREPIFWHSDVLSYTDAPTISQVLKWLREEKYMFVCAYIMSDESLDADGNIVDSWEYWMFDICSTLDAHRIYTEEWNEFESYEEASLAGIEYVLDNLI